MALRGRKPALRDEWADEFALFECFLFRQGKKPGTVRAYLSRVKQFLEWREQQGKDVWAPVSMQEVSEYSALCFARYARTGAYHRLSAIHAYRAFLKARGRLARAAGFC